ncbi:MAG: hypothetical protein ACYTGB_02700 [Planctomycetota bacterium]|jgi:hypothetical protein
MQNVPALSEEDIRDIRKHGCCLGKFRTLLEGTYYCYLADVFECRHQEKRHVEKLGADLVVCETARQEPCETCDYYRAVAAAAQA